MSAYRPPVVRFADQIERCPVRWLWAGRIPVGCVTLLVGDPGVGKSLVAADLCARVSAGLGRPGKGMGGGIEGLRDQAGENSSEQGSVAEEATWSLGITEEAWFWQLKRGVVYVSAEDGAEDTLTPRLAAAGAELSRVCIVEGVEPTVYDKETPGAPERFALWLPENVDALGHAIRQTKHAVLVVLDTLPAMVRSAGAGLIGVLSELGALARRYCVAIVATTHLSKTHGRRSVYRVRGSVAYAAAARSVLAIAADPGAPEARILHSLKSAYGPAAAALRFRIGDGPRVVWDGEALGQPPADLLDLSAEGSSALGEACAWLEGAVSGGERTANEMLREAAAQGIRPRTLHRAKRMLGVRSRRTGQGVWVWGRCEVTR